MHLWNVQFIAQYRMVTISLWNVQFIVQYGMVTMHLWNVQSIAQYGMVTMHLWNVQSIAKYGIVATCSFRFWNTTVHTPWRSQSVWLWTFSWNKWRCLNWDRRPRSYCWKKKVKARDFAKCDKKRMFFCWKLSLETAIINNTTNFQSFSSITRLENLSNDMPRKKIVWKTMNSPGVNLQKSRQPVFDASEKPTLRHGIWNLMDCPRSSPWARLYACISLFMTALSVTLFVIEVGWNYYRHYVGVSTKYDSCTAHFHELGWKHTKMFLFTNWKTETLKNRRNHCRTREIRPKTVNFARCTTFVQQEHAPSLRVARKEFWTERWQGFTEMFFTNFFTPTVKREEFEFVHIFL